MNKLTKEEFFRIKLMTYSMKWSEISEITGRSRATIGRVKASIDFEEYCSMVKRHAGVKKQESRVQTTMLEKIRKSYIDAMMVSGGYPEVITMSKKTSRILVSEVLGFICIEKIFSAPQKVFGMKIVHDDRLPDGLFVIGGLIGPARDK